MSLLSYMALCRLLTTGAVEGSCMENVNSSSIDLTLGNMILIEGAPPCTFYDDENPPSVVTVKLSERQALHTVEVDISAGGFLLMPGHFILAHTREKFNLPPDVSAEYKLKSSMARIGLEHLNAGWCDAGWNGSVLTLELKNMTRNHAIHIQPGDKIGQMVFFEHVPVPIWASYASRGAYNGHSTVTGVQPAKEPGDVES